MSTAVVVIFIQKIKKIINELVELEKELCTEDKPKLQEIIQKIREEIK
jgi:hypothetical protein